MKNCSRAYSRSAQKEFFDVALDRVAMRQATHVTEPGNFREVRCPYSTKWYSCSNGHLNVERSTTTKERPISRPGWVCDQARPRWPASSGTVELFPMSHDIGRRDRCRRRDQCREQHSIVSGLRAQWRIPDRRGRWFGWTFTYHCRTPNGRRGGPKRLDASNL